MAVFRRRKSSLIFPAIIVMMICLFAAKSFGQGTVLRGLVLDEEKKPVQKVKIVLLDPERGTKFETQTNKKGEFMKVGLPPATYQATFELEGFFLHEATVRLVPGMEDKVSIVMKKIPVRIDQDKEFTEGIGRFQEGKYQESVDIFLKVRERFPEHIEIFYNLGVAYIRLGQADKAIEVLEKAIGLKADAVEPYLALGECYLALGQNDKAMETFGRAVNIAPGNPAIYVSLGLVCYKADKIDEAAGYFEKAIELDPKLSIAYYQAGLAGLKKGDYPKAVKHFETFLELDPNAPEAKQVRTIIDELKKPVK